MTASSRRKGGAVETAALFVTILLVSIALALWTDWHIVVRGLVAFGAGLVVTFVTSVIYRRDES